VSSIYDSLSNVYSLTSQINALKNQQTGTGSATNQSDSIDPKAAVYELQKNFNEMLNGLISSSDEDKKGSDLFDFLTDYQTSINNLNNQKTQSNAANNTSLNIDSYIGTIENNNSNENYIF
jgi:hypothetical protein